jgi:hypothetical protein
VLDLLYQKQEKMANMIRFQELGGIYEDHTERGLLMLGTAAALLGGVIMGMSLVRRPGDKVGEGIVGCVFEDVFNTVFAPHLQHGSFELSY